MTNVDDYVVAWCPSQNTFFIEHLSVHIENNLRHFRQGTSLDLLVLGVFSSHQDAVEFSEKLRCA